MSGLFRRLRPRAATADESRAVTPAPGETTDAPPAADKTAAEPPLAGLRDLPAGVDPSELTDPRPAAGRRGKLRRRARYLRRARELMLRDLGGLVYEIHRSAGGDRAAHERLIAAKSERLAALDAELRALDRHLGLITGTTVLREPGIGGTCPACGELHASDARFCAHCGADLAAGAAPAEPAASRAAPRGTQTPATAEHAGGGAAPAGTQTPATAEPAAGGATPAGTQTPATAEPAAGGAAPAEEEEPAAEPPGEGSQKRALFGGNGRRHGEDPGAVAETARGTTRQ